MSDYDPDNARLLAEVARTQWEDAAHDLRHQRLWSALAASLGVLVTGAATVLHQPWAAWPAVAGAMAGAIGAMPVGVACGADIHALWDARGCDDPGDFAASVAVQWREGASRIRRAAHMADVLATAAMVMGLAGALLLVLGMR